VSLCTRDSCDLEVALPSGQQSTVAALGTMNTDNTGHASWAWTIGGLTAGTHHPGQPGLRLPPRYCAPAGRV